MKNIFQNLKALSVTLAVLTLLACAPAAKAAGTYYRNSLLNGSSLVLSNNFAYTNGIHVMGYTPVLSEQYPIGFGGGTNWWANGWSFYTNQSGVIVTNPLPVFQTNSAWATDARFLCDGNGNIPNSIGVFMALQGPDANGTNTVTVTLGGCVGTNHLTAAQNLWSFALKGTGVSTSSMATNPPSSAWLQGCDGVYVYSVTTDNKASTGTYLQQLQLTGWGPPPRN